jgi:hypothetical protein
MKEYLTARGRTVCTLNGTLRSDDGTLLLSTEADDPQSFACVLPRLRSEFEVRFIVPQAAGQDRGRPALDVVAPLELRAGGKIYQARRIMPELDPETDGRGLHSGRTWQDSFSARLSKLLKGAAENPGLFWPFYTHLGAVPRAGDDPRGEDVSPESDDLPSPYFDRAATGLLHDRVTNRSGRVAPNERVWFTRASVLYDYALIQRSIAGHTERPDANAVAIRSWHDAVLDKRLPRSRAQLYGQTFYVDDASVARVTLDGEPLRRLVRNAADETGRQSVTIAEAEIETVLASTFTLTGNGRVISDSIALGGAYAPGAQLLAIDFRKDPRVHFAIVLESEDGGRFAFGDSEGVRSASDGTDASYAFRCDATSTDWQTAIVPFHDLAWVPGRPFSMPNRPLRSLALLCLAPDGLELNIGKVSLLRPRATTLSHDRGFCVGGKASPAVPVYLVDATSRTDPRMVEADQLGFFLFTGVPAGQYRIGLDAGSSKLVAVSANVGNLRLP